MTFVGLGHAGRYFKGTTEPSPGPQGQPTTDWTQIEFNDSPSGTNWIEGPSGYGYSSDSGEMQYVRTPLYDMSGNYISVYARLPFEITQEEIDGLAQLQAEVHFDDGFVLYLNGTRNPRFRGDPGHPTGIRCSRRDSLGFRSGLRRSDRPTGPARARDQRPGDPVPQRHAERQFRLYR